MAFVEDLAWNLRRLIRDGFPKGLPIDNLQTEYEKYFEFKLQRPSAYRRGSVSWKHLFDRHQLLKKWFKVRRQVIAVLPLQEKHLKSYFKLVNYNNFVMKKACYERENPEACSEDSEDESDEDEDGEFAQLIKVEVPAPDESQMDLESNSAGSEASASSGGDGGAQAHEETLENGSPTAAAPGGSLIPGDSILETTLPVPSSSSVPQAQSSLHALSELPETGTISNAEADTLPLTQADAPEVDPPSENAQIPDESLAPSSPSPVQPILLPNPPTSIPETFDSTLLTAEASASSSAAGTPEENSQQVQQGTSAPHDNAIAGTSRNLYPLRRQSSEPQPALLEINIKKVKTEFPFPLSNSSRAYEDIVKEITQESSGSALHLQHRERRLTVNSARKHLTVPFNWVVFHMTRTIENATGRPEIEIYRWDSTHNFYKLTSKTWRSTKIKDLGLPNETILHGELACISGNDDVGVDKDNQQFLFSILDCAVFGGVDLTMLPFEDRWKKCSDALDKVFEARPFPKNIKIIMKPFMLLPNIDQIFQRVLEGNPAGEDLTEPGNLTTYSYQDDKGDWQLEPIHGLLVMRTASSFGSDCDVVNFASFTESMKNLWYWPISNLSIFFDDLDPEQIGRWKFLELMDELMLCNGGDADTDYRNSNESSATTLTPTVTPAPRP